VPLPLNGERDGTWQILVTRQGIIEFGPPLTEERYFVTAVVDGGPYFHPLASPRYYTGDVINPFVVLREPGGFKVEATVTIDIQSPDDGTGNILRQRGLRQNLEPNGDSLDLRSSSLITYEQEKGQPLITTTTQQYTLSDDGEINGRGTLEPDGVFGNPLQDIARYEGNYNFHAKASYGEAGCGGIRETFWSINVSLGIDPSQTTVDTTVLGTLPDGRQHLQVRFTPQDKYGNFLGPGRLTSFEVHGQAGCELISTVNDLGNGTYTQEIACDSSSPIAPGLILTQPERPPIIIAPSFSVTDERKTCIFWLLLAILLLLLLLLLLTKSLSSLGFCPV
jgi:hypothetical protein